MHLQDIEESIGNIEDFSKARILRLTARISKPNPRSNGRCRLITEAAIRLGDDAEALCPGLDWKGFRGMGNILRHGYHRVDDRIVWDTVKDDIPSLLKAVQEALRALSGR